MMRFFISLASLASLVLFSGLSQAQTWIMDPAQSSLSLNAQVYGAPFEATFESFETDIRFDPEDLAAANVVATISLADIAPAIADDAVYISELQGADWFFSDQFPVARFESQNFSDLGGGSYRVDGTLSIKDQASPVSFDFDLDFSGDQVVMNAEFPVNRFDLGLGLLTHPNEGTVNAEVMINLKIIANQ